ncbi:DUF2705 family protein [Paenibacillus sp. IB182496]|uniref:DUF2705 family protein n=1 Tax=Paenibacillus sabuli TaxID=2772509 RepID=A0A927BUM3_9BACL|nr:DUF2705 family protein [Paenibacillus sabuli]
MSDFWQLVTNENMKIYRRPRTWIMLGVLLAITAAVPISIFAFEEGGLSMWMPFQVNTSMSVVLVTVFAVVLSAESVAGEFSSGTIKLLLIRPWSRSKLLLSKYIALLLFALLFMVGMLAWNLGLNALLFGYDGSNEMGSLSALNYFLQTYLFEFITLVVIVTISFLISTVFRSGGLAIGLSIFLLLIGSAISGMLSLLDYAWVKYLLFVNLDLTTYIGGGSSMIEGTSLGFSLAVLAAYYVVFVVITWIVFSKRDVAA